MAATLFECNECLKTFGAPDDRLLGTACTYCKVGRLRIFGVSLETSRSKVEEGAGELDLGGFVEEIDELDIADVLTDAGYEVAFDVPAGSLDAESRSWHLMACDECDFKERMSLSVESIACPKKCKGVMRPVDQGIARRIAGYEKANVYPIWASYFRDSEAEALTLAAELRDRGCNVYQFNEGYATMPCYGEYGPSGKWLVSIFDESGVTVGQLLDKAGVMPEGFEDALKATAQAVGVANWRDVNGRHLFNLNEQRKRKDDPISDEQPTELPIDLFVTAQRATKKVVRFLKAQYSDLKTTRRDCVFCRQRCILASSTDQEIVNAETLERKRVEVICHQCCRKHGIDPENAGMTEGQVAELASILMKRTVARENAN